MIRIAASLLDGNGSFQSQLLVRMVSRLLLTLCALAFVGLPNRGAAQLSLASTIPMSFMLNSKQIDLKMSEKPSLTSWIDLVQDNYYVRDLILKIQGKSSESSIHRSVPIIHTQMHA